MNKNILYSLNTEDIHTVSLQEVGRKLSTEEIRKVKEIAASKIDWYEAISQAISEVVTE